MNKLEYRDFEGELRISQGRKIEGYAAVFEQLSGNLGGFREKVARGAFKRSLSEGADVRALVNHNSDFVLGRSTSGTLRLSEDAHGLKISIDAPQTTWANDLLESIRRQDINQMSFGFRCREDSWEARGSEKIRTLLDVDLVDVSCVAYPAYTGTSVSVRKDKTMNNLRREFYNHCKAAQDVVERSGDKLSTDGNNEFVTRMLKADECARELRSKGVTVPDWRQTGMSGLMSWFEERQNEPVDRGPFSQATIRDDGYAEVRKILRREIRGGDLQADKDLAGGFLMPEVFHRDYIEEKKRRTVVRQLCTTIPMDVGENLVVPRIADRVRDPRWTSELNLGVKDDQLDFQRVSFTCRPLAVYIKVSVDLLESSGVDIAKLVRDQLAYKASVVEENAFLNGAGPGPLGVFVADSNGIDTDRDCSTGNTTTEIKADGLIETLGHLEPQYIQGSTWLFHPNTVTKLRKLKTGAGDFIWRAGLMGGEPNTILDRPYTISMYAPNVFTTGLYAGIVGDWASYWIVEARKVKLTVLDQLFMQENMIGYALRQRLDANCVDSMAFARLKLA